MRRLPPRVVVYIVGVAAVTGVALILSLWAWGLRISSLEELLLVMGFAVLIGLAYHYPLLMARHLHVQVETAALFAALLLFRPPLAILVAVEGVACSLLVSRRMPLEIIFNTSQTGLSVALAATAYRLILTYSVLPAPLNAVSGVLVAALVSYLGNTLLVATVVGLQLGMNPIGVWVSNWRYDILEHVALYLLGVLTALVVQHYSWALLLTAVPLAIVHISLQRSVYLRRQTKEAIEALADVVDMRDPYTSAHSRRVAEYAYELARALRLPPHEVEVIASAARVHDLGKVGVVEAVLNKPDGLDEAEWKKMRQHPRKGALIVSRFPYYAEGRELIEHHHERMDGQGYPDGIPGEQLSIGARIIAVADGLDAMTSDRVYRKALPLAVVREEFLKGAGTQWDAGVVDRLLAMLPQEQATEETLPVFAELANRLHEHDECPGWSSPGA